MKKSTHTPSHTNVHAERLPNERLKAQRMRKNWSQVYVATQIGTNDGEISRWETGSTVPGLYFREKLCALFGKTPEELGFVSPLEETPQRRKEVSPSFWNIPYRRNPFFTGREENLARLHAQLRTEQAAGSPILAISGLGGIGKTQIAIEYAYRYLHDYAAVLWAQADTYERLLSELAALAPLFNLPEQQAQDQGHIVKAVKRWFQEHTNWLLILDNVEDTGMVSTVIPAETGHVLLTTRAQASGSFARHINLEKMALNEGALFLLRRTKMLGGDEHLEQVGDAHREQARAIARVLDGLPLALDQAGAYIEETGCSLSDYLDRYRVRRADLLNRRGRLVTDHPESVSTTFLLSFEQVERVNVAAADLLRLCAFLDPDAIPEEMITESAPELGPVLAPVAADPLAFDEALAVLRTYSLVHRHPETRTLTIHRLVQVVLKDRMDENAQRQWAERTIRVVHRVFPREGTFETWPCCQRYLPHAQSCVLLIGRESMRFPEAAQLLTRTGAYLKDRARYSEAERLLQRALHLQQQSLEPAYRDLAETLHHFGQLYFEQGRYREAESCWQQAITLQEEHLEDQYLDRAESLKRLGTLYLEQGRDREAEPLFQQALAFQEEHLEFQHASMAHSLIRLGWCYIQQNRYSGAEPLLQRALALLERRGPQHLYIIHSLHHLGRLYMHQGRYNKAEVFFQRGLALWEQLEFPHPCTARIFNGLASLYVRQGNYSEAEMYFRRALTFWEQVNFQYPLVAESLNGLAHLLIQQGNYTEAESLLQRALNIGEQWLGREHPDTLTTVDNYADLLVKMHREEEATALKARIKEL